MKLPRLQSVDLASKAAAPRDAVRRMVRLARNGLARRALCALTLSTAMLARPASAELIFSFSFDNTDTSIGNTAGPIEGLLYGLTDSPGVEQSATKIELTAIGEHADTYPVMLPFDILSGGWIEDTNRFMVENGQIIAWDAIFLSGTTDEALDLGISGAPFGAPAGPAFETDRGPQAKVTAAFVTDIQFSQVSTAIPESASLVLLGLAVGGMAVRGWRRNVSVERR